MPEASSSISSRWRSSASSGGFDWRKSLAKLGDTATSARKCCDKRALSHPPIDTPLLLSCLRNSTHPLSVQRLIETSQLEEQRFEAPVILVFVQFASFGLLFGFTQPGDGQFELVAAGSHVRGEAGFEVAANQGQL